MKVLVVGSSVIDLFIQLDDAGKYETGGEAVSFKFGDKIPIDVKKMTIGGGGANVSVGLRRLSIDTKFFTYLGNDIFSKEIIESVKKEGIEILLDQNQGKSSLSLIFDFKKDRIIFSNHEKRNYSFSYKNSENPDFIFLASVGDCWEEAYKNVLEFAKDNNVSIFIAPGTHQIEGGKGVLDDILKTSEIVFMNKDEAKEILDKRGIDCKEDIKELLTKINNLGPKIVSITDGLNDAYCLDKEGRAYRIGVFSDDDSVVEKTGAGDAYASGFVASYVLGNDIGTCMEWGSINAHYSMQKIGAQDGLLTKEEMLKIIEEQKDFRAEQL